MFRYFDRILESIMGFKSVGQGVRHTAFSVNQLHDRDNSLAAKVHRALKDMGVDPPDARPSEVLTAITHVAETLRSDAAEYREYCKRVDPHHPPVEAFVVTSRHGWMLLRWANRRYDERGRPGVGSVEK
jgi:hypothetical protein